ncbi:MAG TPA: amino acid adenylation domain-containing protein, partial [Candidatus Angelobacter sp.]|nr:amino acid adenylation domain-containing protein [Candidatus Angelobacter sp.]
MTAVIEFLNKLASKGVKLSVEGGRLNCYAKKGVLTDEIRSGIAKHKPDIIALLERRQERPSPHTDTSPSGRAKEGAAHAGYWERQLEGELPAIEILPDFPRPASTGIERQMLVEELPEELHRWVADCSGTYSLPPAVIFLAVFQLLLHRYTGQDDIIVGMVCDEQRFSAEAGHFTNMVPVRTRCEEQLGFKTFLSSVHSTMLDALAHSGDPLPLMLDRLPHSHKSEPSIFQVAYAYQSFAKQAGFTTLPPEAGLSIENIPGVSHRGDVGFGDISLGLAVYEQEKSCDLRLTYDPALYRQETAQHFLSRYRTLLKEISKAPDLLIREYSIVTEQEKQRLLVEYAGTHTNYPKDKCIHDLFVRQALMNPGKTAIVFGKQELSYQELYDKSRDLALYLQSTGVKSESVVGLCIERSVDMIVGLLGILQAGGAYMPLDPDYPEDRLAYMLQESRAAFVLTQKKLLDKLTPLVAPDVRLIALDQRWPEITECAAGLRQKNVTLQQESNPRQLAYVTFTSGSTGKPKGVMVEHQSVNRLVVNTNYIQIAEDDVFLLMSSLSFDAATFEIWGPLANGSKLVIAPHGLSAISQIRQLVKEHRISVLWLTSALFQLIVKEDVEILSDVRVLLAGGDVVPIEHAREFASRCSRPILVNGYGPTENTTFSSCYVASNGLNEPMRSLPIGRPISNTQIYILDARNNPQPVGIPGELHVAGDGLARGYLNRAELTAEKFVANPFAPGERMYKTGDLARWLPDGNIEFLGRLDTQVKVRGFRIETSEIEAALNRHPAIRDSVVVAQGDEGNKQLIAFYVARDSNADGLIKLPGRDLRTYLQQTLPAYMLPSAFVNLAAIPLNSNGKVDRRALALIEVRIASDQEYIAPRTDVEKQLVEIWAQVLNVAPEKIGVNDNFFELGGHSLLATQLIAKIRSMVDIDLPLTILFERSSVAQLADLIAKAEKRVIPAIRPVDRAQFDRLPLSFAQERLWFIDQFGPGNAGYNVPVAVTISGELNISQLEHALNLIVARHESLRTIFPCHEGRAQQLILDHLDFRLERIDLSHSSTSEERNNKANEICRTEATTPFDLARGPLIRGKVIKLAEEEHVLLLNMHHIITDGWSLGILTRELGSIMETLRQGRNPELPTLPIQYVDYAVWQRAWLEESGTLQQQLGYWQEKLAGAAESLDLATDYSRPNIQGFAGATHVFTLDAQLTGQLKSMAQQQGGTLYMVLLAAFKILLHRYTGQSDICVGSPIANRQYGETEGLVGMFVNTLALRSQVESEDTFPALLPRVKAACLEAYEHQDAPFEKVVDMLHPQRNAGTNPIFQVMVILQNADMGTLDQHFPWNLLQTGSSLFDLTAEFTEIAEGLAGTIKYSTALYKQATIARMARHFAALCQAIITTPTAKIHDLDYLSDAEKQRLLVDYNGTQADYPKDKCLHELFIEQAALHGGDLALVCGDEQLTYQQLYERSQKLALYLQSMGIKPDSLVGLCMERSLDMVVGLLGILQAGGAYVPLDPSHPDDRLAHALQDSQATVVLTQKHLQEKLNALKPTLTQVIPVDEQWMEIGERVAGLKARKVDLQQSVRPNHLAYVIYTSGSTGLPKGVMVEHRSVVNLFFGLKNSVYRGLKTSGLRVSMNGPLTFDTSVKQIIQLLAGHVLDIVPESVRRDSETLLRFVRDRKIEVFDCTPSQLRLLLEAGLFRENINGSTRRESLQLVLVGGEAIDDAMWTALAGSGIRFFNVYGPTECTVDATVCPVLPEHAPQSIGAPITNTQIYILDSHSRPQPIGVPGELHIAGDGLARGYLNRPELTREKFAANPFTAGERMYKTGDLARWLDDGNIQYLGRIDTQVKVRGFRIELGEIEAQLNLHPQIQDSAVIAKDQDGSKQLIAFYRAKETTAEQLVQLPNEELREHLLRTLPDYMAPAAFVSLAAIPLSPNGKVDRRALARIEVKIASDQEYLAPRNEVEKQLVEIWAQVLHLAPEKIGVNDNFFELGGHSLLATQVMAKIRSRLGIDLPLKALFERTRVAQLAELIPQLAKRDDVPTIRPVDRTRLQRLPLSFAQERLWFIDQLEPNSAGYNLPLALTIPGDLDIGQVEQALNVIIARHENLRTVFPTHEGQAQQLILDEADFKLERIDLSHDENKSARDNHAQEICRTEIATSFDLARGPLIRGKVIKLAEQEHVLLLNMHHIITDGWSLGILTRELVSIMEALRQGHSPELAPLPIQYVDYAVWQRAWLEESGTLQQQLAYWQEKLAGAAESLDLATDYPRPSVQTLAGAEHLLKLDAQLTGRLKSLAQHKGGTLYMVLLAAFKVLLQRYTGQSDICVGSPIANRQYGETEGLIGMFVNTLALRSQVESEDTFSALLSQVKAACLGAYEHQDAPFEKVVDLAQTQRDLSISPLFQVMLILQSGGMEACQHFQPYALESGVSKFDITISLEETAAGLAGFIAYSTALFKRETIARMGEHFVGLCRAITATPTAKIRDLDYLGSSEKQQLLVDYNATRADYPRERCIHDFFIEQVRCNPGKRAVALGGQELSYQELYEKSCELALYLQSLGVKPDSVVGLCLERSLEMMLGIMGIVQAGGAYLPADPAYPDDRLEYMLQDSQATVVLTQSKFRNKIGSLFIGDAKVVTLDKQWPEISQCAAGLKAKHAALRQEVKAHNLSYVIYTSGSTGKPKGVLVEHRALVNRLYWMQKRYPLAQGDVVLQKTP